MLTGHLLRISSGTYTLGIIELSFGLTRAFFILYMSLK